MNSEVPYQDTISIRSLIKSMGPCVYKQSLYALPLFPDVGEWGDGEKCTSQEGDIQYTEDESAQ